MRDSRRCEWEYKKTQSTFFIDDNGAASGDEVRHVTLEEQVEGLLEYAEWLARKLNHGQRR